MCVAVFSNYLTSFFEDPHPLAQTFPMSLKAAAARGIMLRVDMDPQACAAHRLGELRCDFPYEAAYNRKTNTWGMTGLQQGSNKLAFYSWGNAPGEPGYISLWGIVASFDDAGIIYLDPDRKVGKLQIREDASAK